MKAKLLIVSCMATLFATPAHAEFRSWTNTSGTKIDAELVKSEGDNVTLKLRSGKLSTLPLSKLSFADQDFIKDGPAPAAVAPTPSTAETAKPAVDAKRTAKWLTKMDKAQEESKATGLPILVLFTGTSWCPYCIKLEKEVFADKEFKTFANQNLVLLMLDFEAGGVTKDKKSIKLKEQFGVTGFPTYFLADAAGTQLAKGGYHDGINTTEFAGWVKQGAPKN